MTSQLSSDTLNQLLPLLGSLARLVARDSPLGDAQLQTLLLGAGLESDPAALEELKRWGRLLASLRAQPNELREVTIEALMARGVPEAPALLAVDTVAGRASTPSVTSPQRLSASVEHLDLGTLLPGRGAMAELEVQGGPGQVVVENDQVQVPPQQFGPNPTRLRVEVRPLNGAGVVWTTLRLVTAGETLEVCLSTKK